MVAACGIEQENLGNRVPALRASFEQQRSDRFRARRTAGLARAFDRDAGLFERRKEK
jgi:hypothetical protein